MSGRRSKKSQRLGSSRRGPKGLRNTEKYDENDDGLQQTAEPEDGQNEFHTTGDYHSAQIGHPPDSAVNQQTSVLLVGPPHEKSQKDLLMETELPERKRKMGSTRKSTGGFNVEKKVDEERMTEEFNEEYVAQPNTTTTEEQCGSLIEQSKSSCFASNLSLQTESSRLQREHGATLMTVVPESQEKDEIFHQETTSHSYEALSHVAVGKAMEQSVNSSAATVAESDLLRENLVMFEPKTSNHKEGPLARTSEQKRRMGSTRRPLGGRNSENVGMLEPLRNMTDNERKAEVRGKEKPEEMVQTWGDVARDDVSSHTELTWVSNQYILKEADVSAETETIAQLVAFPLADPEKPLHETSSQHMIDVLNKALDLTFTEHSDVLEEAGSHLSDNQHVPDTRNDTSTSYGCGDINTEEAKEEVQKQREELFRNDQKSSLSSRQDAKLEELALNYEKSSLSQHDCPSQDKNTDHFMAPLTVGGGTSFDVPASNISLAEPTITSSPNEVSDTVEELKQEHNVCDVASIKCDTDLECITEEDKDFQILITRENESMSDKRGSETDNAFERRDKGDRIDHNVLQNMMDVMGDEEGGEMNPETSQDHAGKMLEMEKVRDKGETENTSIYGVTSNSEEMLHFDLATDTGSHPPQQLPMQPPDKEDKEAESVYEESVKEGILFSGESKNAAFDARSEETKGIEEIDAAPVLILDVEQPPTSVNTAYNDSESDSQNTVLTEEQTDTSPETYLKELQVSDDASPATDSGFLFPNFGASGETYKVPEENDISFVLLGNSSDFYKLTTFHSESQENAGDAEILPVGGDTDLEIQTEIVDTITVESSVPTESDFVKSATDGNVTFKVSENTENEVPSDISIIPEDSHREEVHSKSSPFIHKRKMGSTRRPLKGDKGQRKEREYDYDHETLDSKGVISFRKETFSLEGEPCPDDSTIPSSDDAGLVDGTESTFMQSSYGADLVSEEPAALSIFHTTELQTFTNKHEVSQENTGHVERVPADGDTEPHSEIQTENKTIDISTSEAKEKEELYEALVVVREVEFIGDTVTVKSNLTIESDLLQNDTFTHAKPEALKVSDNGENVSAMTDSGLHLQDEAIERSGETNTNSEEKSDISIIPDDLLKVGAQPKSSSVVHKRKMGSTRRTFKGNKGQRKGREFLDEKRTLDSEGIINTEQENICLEDEPSLECMFRSSRDGAIEQEREIDQEDNVGLVEVSEFTFMQPSCSTDLVSKESIALSICNITESQPLTKIHEEHQENAGDERAAVEKNTYLQLEIESQNTPFDSPTEETEEDIHDVFGDTITVKSNMNSYSDSHHSSSDAHVEDLNVTENSEKYVLAQTDSILEQSDTSIIPEDSHREEAQSISSPVVHKRKMGSTRRPLKGDKGQRKEREYHDENETLDSKGVINLEDEPFSLVDEPSPDDSKLQSSKDEAKVQEIERCEKNDVGLDEGSEYTFLQSSCDLVSEESTLLSIYHITESQTLTKIYKELQGNAEDAESMTEEREIDLQLETESQNKTFDSTTSKAEGTEENIHDVSVSVKEVEVFGDTITMKSNMNTESDSHQSSSDAHKEALKVSDNGKHEFASETNIIPKQSDISIFPEDLHREEVHTKSSPIVQKRKMGSTRRQEHQDEIETHNSEIGLNVETETFSFEDEPSPNETILTTLKDEAKKQKRETSEDHDIESTFIKTSYGSDLESEESTALSICHFTESQPLTKIHVESQKNAGDEKVPTDGGTELHSEIQTENKTIDLTSEAEENICEAGVLVREVEFIGDTVTVGSNITAESHLFRKDTFTELEALKVSENPHYEAPKETEMIPKKSDINIIPEDIDREEAHTKLSPIVHKRKMGSSRRPLKGSKGQGKGREYDDENETLDSKGVINAKQENVSLEDETSLDKSTSRRSRDKAKEQERETAEKEEVGLDEGSECTFMQLSLGTDILYGESAAVSICNIIESQTLESSQENPEDAERVVTVENVDLCLEAEAPNKISDPLISDEEGKEQNIPDTVLVREVEIIRDTVTVEFNMTAESHVLQTFPNSETFKLSANADKDVSGDIGSIFKQSDTNIIPEDFHREEAHSKISPVVSKRKMGSTRRPLRGNKGQRKDHIEKEILSCDDEPSPDESTYTIVGISGISESQENAGDVEKVPTDGDTELHSEIQTENKPIDLTFEKEENICEAGVLVRKVEFIGDTVTVGSKITAESDLSRKDTFTDAELEALKVSENAHYEAPKETEMITKINDINIIPEDIDREEAHTKLSPIVHKRKMGSTRRPLKGNKGQGKVSVESKELSGEEETELHLEIQDLDGMVDHSATQEIRSIKDYGDEERKAMEQEQRTDVYQTPDSITDNLACMSHSDLVLSDTLLMKETQIHVSSEDVVIGDSCVPPTEVAEIHSVSHKSSQKIKIGSTRKRGKRMVNEEEDAEEKEEIENTTIDDGSTKFEEKKHLEEATTDSPVHQQLFSFSSGEGHDNQDTVSESNPQTEIPKQNDPISAINPELLTESECSSHVTAEMVSDLVLRDIEPNLVSKQSVISEESHREDQSKPNTVFQKRKMGSTRKTLRGNKGQRRPESKHLEIENEGMKQEQDTEPYSETSERKYECKFDEELEQNHVESSHRAATSNKFSDTDNGVKVVSLNIHDHIHKEALEMAEDTETKKAEDELNDIHVASKIMHFKEGSPRAFSTTDLESDMIEENNISGPENTLQTCDNLLVTADVAKEQQPETVTSERRRKMGSTRKTLREGKIQRRRDGNEDPETVETNLQISQDSEISLVVSAEQTIYSYFNQSDNSLLSEIEQALNKTSENSLNYELIATEPNSGDLVNVPDLSMQENSDIKSLQLSPSKPQSEPNSLERRRRKMGSTRRNPRQQLKADREDEENMDEELEENLEMNKQENKDLDRVEVTENQPNKEYLDIPIAHTSSQQEGSANPAVQEKASPSTKRKFGSRRANKGKQGLGRLDTSDNRNELEDGDDKSDNSEVNLHNDNLVDQPNSQPISEQSSMESRNEEVAEKGTGAGLVCLDDHIIKHDRGTGTRQTINLKNRISDTKVVQFNVVMVGNSCVGKTSFIRRFHEGQFTEDYRSTIGIDTCVQTVELPDRTVKLQIWDTAGQERFHSITTQVFHKADGLLLMYEITCSKSFLSVRDWISQAQEKAPNDVIMMLLGNKCDSVKREVQVQEGADLAREYNINFIECSAANATNVTESMRTLAELLVQQKRQREKHTMLRREPPQKKSGCC